ncbi:hypothetical protein V492_06396 [Pseudogymnoascus sp. VKM F-4246]|nr:hypothetical protein V492_06396 [Pseudogymnoascus sp. VKM F-4246]
MSGPIKGDYNVPLRRRLRPAISCIECRRRKIKCDRAQPCGHCRQSRGITCVYSKHTRPANEHRQRSAVTRHEGIFDHISGGFRQDDNSSNAPREKTAAEERHRRSHGIGFTFATCGDLDVIDDSGKGKLKTKIPTQGGLQMYFYGQSHWKHNLMLIAKAASIGSGMDHIAAELQPVNIEMRRLTERYKTIARETKASYPPSRVSDLSLNDYFPARDVADQLVQNYFRTMESTHRILHIPSFKREYEAYWRDPQRTSDSSALKILLVMAIGTCFYQEADSASLRTVAQQWVHRGQAWVSGPFGKDSLNLSGLQIQCLLLLARHTNNVGPDLTWIATGTLLHSAFQLGLHRDPEYFPQMSILHGELRRRLWATILDLAVQTSLETGMPPILALHECDTLPPANIDDEAISSTTSTAPTPLPSSVYTDTSLQIHMLASLHTRYHITRHLNNLQSNPVPPHEELLRLGAELSATCNTTAFALRTYPLSLAHPSSLHARLLDLYTRRFLLFAHRPFALISNVTADDSIEAQYAFSREVCIKTAMILTEPEPEAEIEPVSSTTRSGDYTRLLHIGGGLYRTITLSAFAIICHFLIQQYQLAPSPDPFPPPSTPRVLLHARLQQLTDLSIRRLALGTTSVKWHLLLSIALGHADALVRGEDGQHGILEGAKRGTKVCSEVLGVEEAGRMGDEQVSREVMDLNARKSEGQLGQGTENLGEDDFIIQGQDVWAAFDFDSGALDEWFTSGYEENINYGIF